MRKSRELPKQNNNARQGLTSIAFSFVNHIFEITKYGTFVSESDWSLIDVASERNIWIF